MRRRRIVVVVVLSIPLGLPVTAVAYEQEGGRDAHQWITQQAVLNFHHQFGRTEIEDYLGSVAEYPTGDNAQFIEGAYDEDVAGQTPFNDTTPFARHFWAHTANFRRTFDVGLATSPLTSFDAAPNRAIKYFTGGSGLTGSFDSAWGSNTNAANKNDAARDQGIVWRYTNSGRGRAYYWLGNVAHLLEDITLPVHAHAQQHLPNDPDPVHDFVDGYRFSLQGTADGGRAVAAFTEAAASRYQMWSFDAPKNGVGRGATFDASPLRSSADLRDLMATFDADQMASYPNTAALTPAQMAIYNQSLPLYNLFLETASLADDFDDKDNDGQRTMGNLRATADNDNIKYNNWTRAEILQVADVAVPRAMRATGELIRYFYSLVDPSPATVDIENLSKLLDDPTVQDGVAHVHVAAFDETSGYDLDGFRFDVDRKTDDGWALADIVSGKTDTVDFNLPPGTYRFRATIENGAGLFSETPYAYLKLTPEPAAALPLFSALLLGTRRSRPRGR